MNKSITQSKCTSGQPGATILFTAARPASTELCPAGVQVCTDAPGRGSLPQGKPTATYSNASGRIRRKQFQPTVPAVPAQVAALKVPPPAGKLLYHLRTWRTITQDPWVLIVMEGYEITGEIPLFTFSCRGEKQLTSCRLDILMHHWVTLGFHVTVE